MDSSKQPVETQQTAPVKRQTYCAPKLTRYGELAALTQSGASQYIIETSGYRRPVSV